MDPWVLINAPWYYRLELKNITSFQILGIYSEKLNQTRLKNGGMEGSGRVYIRTTNKSQDLSVDAP
jgi:hypothetical protein